MDDLIEALTIFRKYGNLQHPTACEHDVLYVLVGREAQAEAARLNELGFHWDESLECWASFRYGSA